MVLSVVVILLVGVVAYFHYVQGLLSGVLSAVLALVSAALALSYYEPLVAVALGGKMANQAHGMVLVALFAAIYLILRTIFDSLVPGNIRFPAIVDKIGGAVGGFIAGMCALGVMTIAAQLLPFGPSIGGYARYELGEPRPVQLPTRGQAEDTLVKEELKSEKINLDDAQALLLPVDDFVVGLTAKLSDGGSLGGDRPLKLIHPALLDEAFFNRLGIQAGANRVAINGGRQVHAVASSVFAIGGAGQVDAEIPQIRKPPLKLGVIKSTSASQLLVVRVRFSSQATDGDQVVRVSPASVRLVAAQTNYLPLGTLENGVLAANKPDDFLFVNPEQDVDFVFEIKPPDAVIKKAGADKSAKSTVKNGVFIEVKRMARTNLAGMPVIDGVQGNATGVIRKQGVKIAPKGDEPSPNQSPEQQNSAAPPTGPGPFQYGSMKVDSKLGFNINVGQLDSDSGDVKFNSGSATLAQMKFVKLDVRPLDALTDLIRGDYPVGEFFVPVGKKLVQLAGRVPPEMSEPWTWAINLGKFDLVDSSGGKYQPHGAWAKVTRQQKERMVAKYDAAAPVVSIAVDEAIPTDLTLLFQVPDKTQLTHLNFKGKKIADVVASLN